MLSVLVVSYNTRDLVIECLESLHPLPAWQEVVVVDNASTDGSADALAARFPGVTLVRSGRNLGFAAGVNRAAAAARGDALLLLNPDARLCPGALDQLSGFLSTHPRAGAVGGALTYADGAAQDSAFRFPGLAQVALDLFPVPRLAGTGLNGRYPPAAAPFEVDFPLGACLLIRRAAWGEVGPLDEGYFLYAEEVDWCWRARQRGWEVWHHPGARAVHHAAQSTRQHSAAMFAQLWRSRLRYYQRYHGRGFNAILHMLLRAGLRAEHARAQATLRGPALDARLAALDSLCRLVA